MAGQKLWGPIKPYDDTMLHEAPVLPSDDRPTASCYDALGEGHKLLQFKQKFGEDEREREISQCTESQQTRLIIY